MKGLWILLLVVFFAPMLSYGQLAVVDAVLEGLITGTWIEEALFYGEMIANDVIQIEQIYTHVEYTIKAYERQIKNLETIGDIRSWDDFKQWHNRQLYLEKLAEESFTGMNVSIGNKNYSITDVEGIASGARDNYVEFWNKEFTEDQRQEMWMGLGLTPSNYAYVQTWGTRLDELQKLAITNTTITNEQYMENLEFAKNLIDKYKADKGVGGIDDKEIQVDQMQMLVAINKALNDLNMSIAYQAETQAVQNKVNATPKDAPVLSEWSGIGFDASSFQELQRSIYVQDTHIFWCHNV